MTRKKWAKNFKERFNLPESRITVEMILGLAARNV